MYKRRANGWLKHWDFILIDLIVIQVAYVLSLCFAGYISLYETSLYRNIAIILEAINIIAILVFSTFRDVLKKGHYLTFVSCLQQGILIGVTTILYLFVIQKGQDFSRLTILYTAVIYVLLSYICRELWKLHLLKYFSTTNSNKQSLLIITDKDNALNVIGKVDSHLFDNYTLTGISLFDDTQEKEIKNIPIVCTIESVPEFICKE